MLYSVIINDSNPRDQICTGTHIAFSFLRLALEILNDTTDVKSDLTGGVNETKQIFSNVTVKCNIKCIIFSLIKQQCLVFYVGSDVDPTPVVTFTNSYCQP